MFTGIFFRKALIAGGGSVSKCHLTDFAPHECYYVRATLLGDISSTSSLSLWICSGAFLAAYGGATTYLPYAEALFKQEIVGSSEAELRKHTTPFVHAKFISLDCCFFLSPVQIYLCDSCEKTEFGCCVDLENAARGPDFDGCPTGNDTMAYVDCTLTARKTRKRFFPPPRYTGGRPLKMLF